MINIHLTTASFRTALLLGPFLALAACTTTVSTSNGTQTTSRQIKPLLSYTKTVTFASGQFPLWPNGAPGFEDKKDLRETAQDWWVRDIHNPSLTPFIPRDKKSRAAVIVVPGGGHKDLVFNSEGVRPAEFLNQWGVSAFALKYRLARQDGSPYEIEAHAGEDLRRAVKWLRAHADDYDIDPDKIGVLGFSAGGELVNYITYNPKAANPAAADPIDRQPDHPNFMMQVYPGPLGVPKTRANKAAKSLPPAFFITANDDEQPARTVIDHYKLYQTDQTPIELHVFAKGGHAFNMGTRSELRTISDWPERLHDWLRDQGYIAP